MDDPQPRKLKVDLAELALAFENSNWETDYFLDLETGKVIMVEETAFRDLESIVEDYEDDEEQEDADLTEVLDAMDLEDWERKVILQADQVKTGMDDRYRPVPLADSHEGFQDMLDFTATVENVTLQSRLKQMLKGKHPFRNFKDALTGFPNERQRWLDFKKERIHQRVLVWLAAEGIEIL
jgi:hypothetical protein